MALGTNGSTLNDELNRLANGGTYRNMDQMVDEALAAKQWANREYINPYSTDTVGILNEIAGLGLNKKNWFDFNGVCNYLAGTTGLPAAAALRQIQNTSDLITSNATYYVDATAPTNWGALGYVYLNGVAGNYLSTPDATALDVTGDIDIRARLALDDWTPGADAVILSKESSATTRSYRFYITTSGNLGLIWSADGSATISVLSTVANTITDGTVKWVRVTLDVDNGASGNNVQFFTSDDGTTWTQLGTTVTTAGVTSIFNSTSPLEVGSRNLGTTQLLTAKVYRAQVLNGIGGTTVLDINVASNYLSSNQSFFTATTGQTVTVNGVDVINNLGTGGDLLPTTLGSSTAADSNDPKFLDFTGTNYVYLPGTSGDLLSVPNATSLQITGDIDLRWYGVLDSISVTQPLINRANSGSTRSYRFEVNSTGTLQMNWSVDGTNTIAVNSTVAITAVNTPIWLRATLSVASNYAVIFYTSTNGTTWTQLGTTVTGVGATSIVAGNSDVWIGRNVNSVGLLGKVYRAQIFNGIDGTKVLDVDTSVITSGADTYVVPVTYTGQAGAYFTGTGLSLNGDAGNYISTPDASTLDITGDIDVQVKVAMTDWTPASAQTLIGKWATGGNLSYDMEIGVDGKVYFYWTTNGSTVITKASSVATGITDGSTKWVRATLDVDNGASGNDVKFYLSDDGSTWTQLGTTQTTAGVTSIYSGAASLAVGANSQGNGRAIGTFYRAIVKSGINGYTVFDADFTQVPANALRMTESSLNAATVSLFTTRYATINRSTSGRKSVAVTQPTWLFGTDDYMEVNNRYMASGTYLYLPGVASNYASTPDANVLDVTGDLDLRLKLALDDWTPSALTYLFSKYQGAANVSYAISLTTAGLIQLSWSANGSTILTSTSTVAPTVADGAVLWVRATLDVNNGASGNDVIFYTSTDGTTWTQLGSTVTKAGTTSIFAGTSMLEIGSVLGGTSNAARGKFFRAQVLNGIDGTVAFDANFETSITSLLQTSFTESSANAATVTINRSGSAYRSAGITAAGYLYPGATNTFKAGATSLLDFGASDSFTAIAILREWTTPTSSQRILNKRNGIYGYELYNRTTSSTDTYFVGDGVDIQADSLQTTYTFGSLRTLGLKLDRSSQTAIVFSGTTNGTSYPTTSIDSLVTNIGTFTIGRYREGLNAYADMELIGVAVFRSALTASQIRQISNYFANREVYL